MIWNTGQAPAIDQKLLDAYGEQFARAAMKGYGIDLKQVDWSGEQSRTIQAILDNVWQFASAKSYGQLVQMGNMLVAPDGTLRSFKDFSIAARRVAELNLTWAKTEYNTAIGGGQMIALWKKIQEQKHIYPYLRFDAVMDKGTTALCASLNGVVRAVDDWFWTKYYPLNHFGCRSTVVQQRKGDPTPDDKIKFPEIPAMFRANIAERGLVFPMDHPYFQQMPPEVYQASRRFMPYYQQFDLPDLGELIEGIVRIHHQADRTAGDFGRLLGIARDKAAMQGNQVDIMPTINPATDRIGQREVIFRDARPGRSPDLRINGRLAEEEASTNPGNLNNIKHAIDAGAKQATHVIISLSAQVSSETMYRVAKGRFKDHRSLEIIEFRYEGTYTMFKRP